VLTLPPTVRGLSPEAEWEAESGAPPGSSEGEVLAEARAEAEAHAELEAVGPEGAGTHAWVMLRQLMRCAEPYCHPSNSGGWGATLGYLLQGLAQFLSWRLLLEARAEAHGGAHAHLRPEDASAMVRLLLAPTTLALYSKNVGLARMAQAAAKYLGHLAPQATIPALQARAQAAGLQPATHPKHAPRLQLQRPATPWHVPRLQLCVRTTRRAAGARRLHFP
jgi:hypothetical protein